MRRKIIDSMLILIYTFLLCLCAALLCSNASAENAVDFARNTDSSNMSISVEKMLPMSNGL